MRCVTLITGAEQAELLSCSVDTLERMRARRIIPYIKMGPRLIRYNPEAVARALEKLTVKERI